MIQTCCVRRFDSAPTSGCIEVPVFDRTSRSPEDTPVRPLRRKDPIRSPGRCLLVKILEVLRALVPVPMRAAHTPVVVFVETRIATGPALESFRMWQEIRVQDVFATAVPKTQGFAVWSLQLFGARFFAVSKFLRQTTDDHPF